MICPECQLPAERITRSHKLLGSIYRYRCCAEGHGWWSLETYLGPELPEVAVKERSRIAVENKRVRREENKLIKRDNSGTNLARTWRTNSGKEYS